MPTDPSCNARVTLPFYVLTLSPTEPGGAWGYHCVACSTRRCDFKDEITVEWLAAAHVAQEHDGI